MYVLILIETQIWWEHCNFYFYAAVDRPLIVQFAAKCGKDLADATEMIVP